MEERVAHFIKGFDELVAMDAGISSLDDYWALEKDWLAYEAELNAFLEKEATEAERRILCDDYWPILEVTFMSCSGYRWERAKMLVEKYQNEGRTPELEAKVREFLQDKRLDYEKEPLEEHLPADLFY